MLGYYLGAYETLKRNKEICPQGDRFFSQFYRHQVEIVIGYIESGYGLDFKDLSLIAEMAFRERFPCP